jgi:hypothetical protein
MDSQLGIEDDFERKPDTGLYDWPNEKYEHKKFQDWPRFNGTINTDIPNSTNNAENTHNSMEEEAPAATASPPHTSSVPASDGEHATLENDPAHTSTDAWHLATYMTANGEKPLWCVGAPAGTREKDCITLVVKVDETKKQYTIMPYFPARNKGDAVLWTDPTVVSNALAQIKTILTKIDLSVCFDFKTKALERNDRETRALWHVAALNTMKARSQDRVDISLGEYPVSFGQASGNNHLVPGAYYPNREDVIRPPKARHVLRKVQADRFFAQLSPDHPFYRPLETKGTARK